MPRKRLAVFNVTSSEALFKLAPIHPEAMLALFQRYDKNSCDYQQELFDIAYVKMCTILFSDETRIWREILDNCIVNGSGSVLHKFGCMILKDSLLKRRSAVAVADAVDNRLTKLNNDTQNKDVVNLGIEEFHIPLFSLFLQTCTDAHVKTLILDLYNNWDRISHPEQILLTALDSKPELVEFAFNQAIIKLNSSLWDDNKTALDILFYLAPKNPDYVTEDLCSTVAKSNQMNADGRVASIRTLGAFVSAKASLAKLVFQKSLAMLIEDDNYQVHNAAINTIVTVAEVNSDLVKPAFNVIYQLNDRRPEVRVEVLNAVNKMLTANINLLTEDVFDEIIRMTTDKDYRVRELAVKIITTLVQIKPSVLREETFKALLDKIKNHSDGIVVEFATDLLTLFISVNPTWVTGEYFNTLIQNAEKDHTLFKISSLYALTEYAKAKPEKRKETIYLLINNYIDCWDTHVSQDASHCLSTLIPMQPQLVNEDQVTKLARQCSNDMLNDEFYITDAIITCVKARPEFSQKVYDSLYVNLYAGTPSERSHYAYVLCLLMKEYQMIFPNVLAQIRDDIKNYWGRALYKVIESFVFLADISPSEVILVAINSLNELLNNNNDYVVELALKTLTKIIVKQPEYITQKIFDAVKAKLNDSKIKVREAAFDACSTLLPLNASLTYADQSSDENYIEEKLIAFYFEGLSAARANLYPQVMNNNSNFSISPGKINP